MVIQWSVNRVGLAVISFVCAVPVVRAQAPVAEAKKDVAFKESPGAHTWTNWREYLNEFAPLLFR